MTIAHRKLDVTSQYRCEYTCIHMIKYRHEI